MFKCIQLTLNCTLNEQNCSILLTRNIHRLRIKALNSKLVEKKYVSYFLAMVRQNPNHGSASLALEKMLNSSSRQQLDFSLPQSLGMQQTNRLHVMSFN